MSKLHLQQFLEDNPQDWKEKLTAPPYNLKISEKDNRVLFKYSQISSDFSNPVVCESRGIILDSYDWSVVCHPMHKFFNYGEGNAAEIDWNTATVMDKIDGSLTKIYNVEGEWRVATNGTIDAEDAELMTPTDIIKNFRNLFDYTISASTIRNYIEGGISSVRDHQDFFKNLNPRWTYLCELATPLNRVVVPYTDYNLFAIVAKHNKTGEERYIEDYEIPIAKQIRRFHLDSIEEVQSMAKDLPYSEEGYVVMDAYNNRVKVKSPAYLAVHRLKGEQLPTPRRIFDLILTGEDGEFLTYFPEYKEQFDRVKQGWKDFLLQVNLDMDYLFNDNEWKTRKEFAMGAKKTTLPGLMFALYDDKEITPTEYVQSMSQSGKDKIIKEIEK